MLTIASDRLTRIAALLLLMALSGAAGQLFAASCDQPQVSFQAGQLTISSNGCSLQQVLTAVGQQTAIETEIPASASTVPVFAKLGPENPRKAVSALLDGVPFNWSLATKEDESRSLVRVVLSERSASPELAKPSMAAAAPSLAANAGASGRLMAGQTPPGGRESTEASTLADDQSNQPRRRAEVDDSTLAKLPPLPPGVPSSMWQLYPGLVQSGGVVQGGPPLLPNGQLAPVASLTAANSASSSFDPALAPKGVINLPALPSNIDPAIGRIYSWNLMQLIQNPITVLNTQSAPMAPPVPASHP